MIITALKTESSGGHSNNGSQLRIGLSDGSLFSFKICYLPPEIYNKYLNNSKEAESLQDVLTDDSPEREAASEVPEGREINAEEEAAFLFASACLRTEKASLKLITRAEQCTSGLSRKLEQRGHNPACVNTVISRLTELKLLDDRRYAQLWLESRLRLTRSPRRLLSALCGRGINRDDAQTALKAALDEEAELAMLTRFVKKYSRKKSGKGENVTRSLKFLLKSEGFSLSVIERFLDED